jgi:hypothetical protein
MNILLVEPACRSRTAKGVAIAKDEKGVVTREVLTKRWPDWVDYWGVDLDYGSKKDRSLELTSAEHRYPKRGRYRIAVKAIDIFGNDTTKVVEVNA